MCVPLNIWKGCFLKKKLYKEIPHRIKATDRQTTFLNGHLTPESDLQMFVLWSSKAI